jgi:hypothetical protein
MRINPSLVFVILLLIFPQIGISQYEGLDSTRKQAPKNQEEIPFADEIISYRYKDVEYSGLDFTAFGSGISYLLELSPYTGFHIDNRFYMAAGLTGSIYSNNVYGTISTIGGVFTFIRIPISNIFIHAEYRYQNSIVSYQPELREWFGTPILGGGYNTDGTLGMYALVGVALNPKFAYTNSLGALVYRFGFRF